MRNIGDRAAGLFSRNKKKTEETAQNVANDVDEAANRASKAALDTKKDVDKLATSAGF